MLGNFSYCNPAKLYFCDQSLDYLNTELPKYGKNVVLIYGGGSIKKNGIYDDVIKILEAQGKNVAEIAGVMPNPTLVKLYEGIEIARKHQTDLLLAVGAYTNATHGMTLAAVSLPYYRYILPYGLPKFKRFAIEVWKVNPEGKADEEIAEEGLKAMEDWMKELGLSMKISELGATKDMIDGIADATLLLEGGYKVLSRKEVVEILKESL